jgi:hypothetical protein
MTGKKKYPPATVSGFWLGIICLGMAVGLLIWDPEFRGLFDRGHNEPPIPIWVVLLGIAALNFVYAGSAYFVYRKLQSGSGEERLVAPALESDPHSENQTD